MKNLIKTIQNTIFQQALFKRGAKIVLGVSGGADSVCMLDVMAKIASKADLKLLIAHVNYGLRGKDSDKDEDFVRELAGKYNLQCIVLKQGTLSPALPRRGRGNLFSENVLRETRYDFFEKVRKENKFDFVAVAHNADDQVETYLMRIIRGAGLQGLSAMKYKNNFIIRPLLGTTRKDILVYLKKNNLKFRNDKTNNTDLFLRNKIRKSLIPYLEKNFNPNIRQTIFQATKSITEDYSLITDLAIKATGEIRQLSAKKILTLHPALQREVIRNFLGKANANLKDIGSAHVAEVLKIVQSTKGKNQVVLCKGLKITRKGDKLIIETLKH